MTTDELQALANEDDDPATAARGRWDTEYLGRCYRSVVETAMLRAGRGTRTVLKTDLWNEALGGARDIAGHFHETHGHRFFGLDLARRVCAEARSRVPTVRVVQADIRALPFRPQSFDVVLDLSTLDHLPEAGVVQALGEYARVLRDGGVLLVVFWQRSLLVRQRLLMKRLLGLREKSNQSYFARADVRAGLGKTLTVLDEFVAGTLFVPPYRLMGVLLDRLPARALSALLRGVAAVERWDAARPLLKHVAGLYGFAALRSQRVAPRPPSVTPCRSVVPSAP